MTIGWSSKATFLYIIEEIWISAEVVRLLAALVHGVVLSVSFPEQALKSIFT
jgi:hypothetical protein